MSIKVLVVGLAGMLFIPAACAPASITPDVDASPVAVSSPSVMACPAPPVLPEEVPAVQVMPPVGTMAENLSPTGVLVQYLELEPNVAELGTNVTVEITLKNTGTGPIVYPLDVKIEGTTVKTQDIALAGGESQNLTLTISAPIRDGVYHVSAGDIYRELDAWS
jgi:hypothetical protein